MKLRKFFTPSCSIDATLKIKCAQRVNFPEHQ